MTRRNKRGKRREKEKENERGWELEGEEKRKSG